jgi:poly(A) polymerase
MTTLRQTAEKVVRKLQEAGFSAFWVGGCVRDVLLGRDPVDYDIATAARPEQVESLFQQTIPVGKQFGVVVVLEDNYPIQVATFRAESDYEDGRHPKHVAFADAKADAERRDFTVNGLFFDPVRQELHDWVAGRQDLKARLVRTIGSPAERFAEDHLRMLRAIRFATQLNFKLAPETLAAVKALAPRIRDISAERIREELIKLFKPPYARRGLELFRESGLMLEILPELAATIDCHQSPDYHPEGSVYNHIGLMLEHMKADASPALPWTVLLHDIAKPVTASRDAECGSIHFYGHERVGAVMAEQILERLRFPRKEIEEIALVVRCHMQFKDAPQMRQATLRRLLMRPTFPLELELHRLDCVGSHGRLDIYDFLVAQARELQNKPQIRPPLLRGDDLLALGIKPGPALGELLERIRDKQLQEELKTAEEAIGWVKQQIAEGSSEAGSKLQGEDRKHQGPR